MSITVPVTIEDDNILENPETFSAVLTTADTDVLLDPDVATVTISDNDSEFPLPGETGVSMNQLQDQTCDILLWRGRTLHDTLHLH